MVDTADLKSLWFSTMSAVLHSRSPAVSPSVAGLVMGYASLLSTAARMPTLASASE